MKKFLLVVMIIAILFTFVYPYEVSALSGSESLSFAAQRLKKDQIVLANLKLPKEVQYNLTKLDDGTVAIDFDFPENYSQKLIVDVITRVQVAIAKDKSNDVQLDTNLSPDTVIGGTTTYYFSGSQYFTGRYGEQIYNSTYGQLSSTRFPAWYYIVITGTSAGVVSNTSSHYSGLKVDTTVHLWGLVVGGDVSSSGGFSLSISPGVVAEFHREWSRQGPYVILDWGQLIAYAVNATKLGVDNTVWVDNSGFVDPYHIYVPRWLYEY
ncbi:MAG: hypothetical protein COS15_05220 [Caldiserica bacterium CG02_land_8_20_14_3_00_36_38]|nr:MAG: hypothetical protein COX13_02525 [Caldiserica bacterium CG23_combo_of_CG06-09_8_20_14_all_35_60]PIV54653.1 MAG: hypothetical protein COS15_05220 [Caldiserica bacterium CG02_land_8_20_14_3_00_36_38]